MEDPYYQRIVEYVKDVDPSIKEALILLEPPISEDNKLEDIENLILKGKTSAFFPKNIKKRFSNAMELHRERNPAYSQGLINHEVDLSKKSVIKFFKTLDKEDTARAMLHSFGYDISGLEDSRDVFLMELDKWKLFPNYYVPITDFFGPERISKGLEERIYEEQKYRELNDSLRHSKAFLFDYLFPLLLLPAYAVGVIGQKIAKNIGESQK